MAETNKLLSYKIAGKKLLNGLSAFSKELRGVYPYQGDKYHCSVCDTGLKYFDPISFEYLKHLEDNAFVFPFFMLETSTIYNYSCPKCRATDRDRLYALYFNKRTAGTDKNKLNIVEFASQHGLSAFLKNAPATASHRTADKYRDDVDDKVDLIDLSVYKDNSVDVFICSHILEYVPDDAKAMKELHRILKPGGFGIAMVPIMLSIEETFEDPRYTTHEEQWKYFMQYDHLRLYSKKGFTNDLKEAGFKVKEFNADYFGIDEFRKLGIQERSVLYIVEK